MKLLLTILALGITTTPVKSAPFDEAAREVVGVWKLEFTTPNGQLLEPYVVVGRQHGEFVAWYVNGTERQAFSNVKLDGDELHLTIRPKEYGGSLKATLVAHSTGPGACAGTIEYAQDSGDSGKLEFRGERLTISKLGETQTWKIGFVDPNGLRHDARVTVLSMGEKVLAWYSSSAYELPAKEMSVTGNRVEMSLSTKTAEGEEVDVTFRGNVEGDQVTGSVSWSIDWQSGSFPFRGERES
jgi:hypothetical protein